MTYTPYRPSHDPSRLTVELVPRTAWWSNVRSNVSRSDWEKCKRFVRARSGDQCEVCGGRGRKWPVECHEEWSYDDDAQIQTLVGLIALCPSCHEVKHYGRAELVGNGERAFQHLLNINEWSIERGHSYVALQYAIWHTRSPMDWMLDVNFLSLLGIEPRNLDRTATKETQ